MNRNYKVIWNASLNCFMAVSEYAKARGKSSKSSVSSNATINTTSNLSSTNAFRLTAIGLGLMAAGLMSPQVFAATGITGGTGSGTAISKTNTECGTGVSQASAGLNNSIAVGCGSVADLSNDPAVHFYQRGNPENLNIDLTTNFNSTSIGTGARATEAGTSLGMNASSSNLGVALGIQAKSENVAALAIGPAALAKGNTSLALGRQSAATADFAQAIGNVASATGKGSLAVGHSARAEGYRSIAIGSADINGASATGTQSGVVYQTNQQTLSKGLDSIAIGSGAIADATFGIGASGTASTAIGKTAKAQGPNTLALGANSDAKNGTAVGSGSIVRNGGLAVGMHADAGPGLSFLPTSNVALGDDSKVTGGGFNVALGAMAVAGDSDLSAQAFRPTGSAVAGENAVGEVSIGGDSSGQYIGGSVYRRITNLAAGAADTDGVNVSQLKTVAAAAEASKIKYVSIHSTGGTNEDNLGASGEDSIAIGKNASATGMTTVAIGLNAGVGSTQSEGVSVGNRSGQNVLSDGNTALGVDAGSNVGSTPRATFDGKPAYSPFTIVGQNTGVGAAAGKNVYGNSNSALGERAGREVDGHANTSVGAFSGNNVIGSANVAMGANAGVIVKGDRNTAIGNFAGAYVDGKVNSAFGNGAGSNIKGEYNLALGSGAGAGITNDLTVAIGNNAGNIQNGQIGKNSISVGTNSSAQGHSSIALGRGSVSAGKNATGIGVLAKAGGESSVAIGDGAEASGKDSIAIGTGNKVIGNNSGAFGDPNIVSGTSSYVVGNNNTISNNNTFVLGNDVVTTQDNSIVLGNLSTDRAATTETGITINTIHYTYAGQGSAGKGVVSVGKVGSERQIINVAAGKVSAVSTDAINGSQLHATNESVKDLSTTVITNKTKYYSVNSSGGTNDDNQGASGQNAMAMGRNAVASGSQAISIGSGASGQDTTASGEQSIAIGANIVSSGASSIAIGGDDLDTASKTNFDGSISTGALNSGEVNTTFNEYAGRDLLESWDAYGGHTEASGAASIAMGAKARSAGNLATAIGIHSSASGIASSAFGIASSATGKGALALGAGAQSIIDDGVALGSRSVANVAGGALGFAPTNASVADKAAITATNSTSLGAVSLGNAKDGNRQIVNLAAGIKDSDAVNVAQLKSVSNTVIANKTKYYSVNSGAVGNADNLGATKPNAMAMGGNASATGGQAIAIGSGESGQNTTASGEQSIAIGANVESSGNSSIAIGGDDLDDASKVNGVNALFNTYTGSTDGLVTVGDYSNHTESGGAASVAIGVKAHSKGDLSTAVGVRSSSSGDASSAFGMGSSASKNGSVALGAGSTTLTDATYQDKLTIGNKDYLYAGATNDKGAQVSVGSSGRERQIKHVASGEVSAASTDAINGSQLFATNEAIGDLGSTVSDGLNFAGDRGAVINRQLGDTLNIKGGAAATTTLTNKNIGIRNDGNNGLIVELAEKVNLGTNGSVNIGNTQVKNTGITIAGSTLSNTVVLNNNGLNNGGFKVVNIDKGNVNATSTDAINGSQLFGTAQSIADNFGGGSIVNTDGTVSTSVYQINGNNQTGVAGAIEELDKGFNLETNGANTSTVKAGDTIDIGTSTGETNIEVAKTGNDIKFKLADNIDLNSVKTGNSVLNNNGLTINNGPSFTATGINAGNQQITKVSSGGNLTDINNQLNAANIGDVKNAIGDVTTLGFGIKAADNNTVQKNLGEVVQIVGSNSNITTKVVNGKVAVDLNNNLNLGNTGSVTTGNTLIGTTTITGLGIALTSPPSLFPFTLPSVTTINGKGLSILGGPSITTAGIDAGNKKVINVKAGSNPLDAVNYSQLETTNEAVNRGLDFTGDNTGPTSVITRKSGQVLKTTGGNTDLTNLSDDNIGVIADNITNTLTVKLAKDLTGLNSASFGSDVMISSTGLRAGATVINTGGVSFSGSTVGLSSSGLNNGGKVITNVARGEETTDAVNVGQLNEVKQSAADANKGWNVSAQGANTSTVKPSDTVDLNNTDNNITVSKTAESNNVSFNLSKDIAVDSVKTGNAMMNSSGLTIAGGPKFTKTSVDAGGNKITNVAKGDIEVDSNDAVNGSQLFEFLSLVNTQTTVIAEMGAGLNFDADSGPVINKKAGSAPLTFKGGDNITTTTEGSSIKFDLNGNINVESVTTGNTTVNNSGVTIINGPSMTAAGIYAGNAETAPSMTAAGINAAGTKVTNVADGMAPRDAVNFGQLDAVSRGLGNSINELGYKIGEVEDDANAGISAAMAMSSLPQAFISGKPMIGGGIATYNGESAVAIGFSKMSNDGRWVMKLNGTADTQGNVGAAIGAGFHFD
ncbi:autotransporter adhesin [Psychrobacter luti]|uniref:Autotransporter adhesin n=1 Tax=Psychrobacter luti TaxID=198481 RepID=A0A839TDU9_9GAMM|nr:YadA-like family protein [Psychrobacter luti]MBB3105763.1 autotransporter adhesin [Psychrobacter luti]